jgi:hypothetical protein
VEESLFDGGVDRKRRIQHLDRDVALEEGIVCTEHGGKPAFSHEGPESELLSERCLELGPQRGDVDAHGCLATTSGKQ